MPKYHKVSMQAMVDESGSDEAHLNAIVNSPEPGRVPDHVVHGMLVHAAAKCLMRGRSQNLGSFGVGSGCCLLRADGLPPCNLWQEKGVELCATLRTAQLEDALKGMNFITLSAENAKSSLTEKM